MTADCDTIFFDFGGTLFSYKTMKRPIGKVMKEGAERLGVDKDRREIGKAYNAASLHAWSSVAQESFYLHRDIFISVYRRFAEELGATASDDFIEWIYAEMRQAMVDQFELREDCLSTLAALRERGHGLAIVSNIDDDHLLPMVERAGLADYLDRWTSSEEARSCKPDPGFFLYCAELADCDPARTLYVGDSPFHDVKGAKAVGMKTALIVEKDAGAPGQGEGETPEPDHTIEQLSELLEIVS
jgi:HAD superfamily hydrolase (TIGR01549 family)